MDKNSHSCQSKIDNSKIDTKSNKSFTSTLKPKVVFEFFYHTNIMQALKGTGNIIFLLVYFFGSSLIVL